MKLICDIKNNSYMLFPNIGISKSVWHILIRFCHPESDKAKEIEWLDPLSVLPGSLICKDFLSGTLWILTLSTALSYHAFDHYTLNSTNQLGWRYSMYCTSVFLNDDQGDIQVSGENWVQRNQFVFSRIMNNTFTQVKISKSFILQYNKLDSELFQI